MNYQPPDSDGVDFAPADYTPPTADGVDFAVAVVIQPQPVALELDVQDAFVSAGTLVAPDPVVLDLDVPSPVVSPGTLVQPEAVELELGVQDAFVSAGTLIEPDPVDLAFDIPLTAGIQPFILNEEWQVDEQPIKPDGLSMDAESTTLTFEVLRSEIDQWRQYDRAGDISVEAGFAGQFRAVDRGGRDDTTEVRPSFGTLDPIIPSVEYLVTSYGEEQVAPDRFEVSLGFQRRTNRDQGFPTLSESGDWEFSLETGTVGLDASHVSRASGSGTTSGPEYDLTLTVSDDQAAALLDNWGYPDGVVERGVSDGTNFLVDESPSSRQTVTISGPSGAILSDGDYLVTSWQVERAGFDADRRWTVDVTLAES